MTHQNNESPCCMLEAAPMEQRVRAWRELADRSLHREIAPGRIVSTYPSTPEITDHLKSLTEAEADCCSFLTFAVSEHEGVVTVETSFPTEFGPMIERVVAPELATRP